MELTLSNRRYILYAIGPIIFLAIVNGFYKNYLFQTSTTLYWGADIIQWVIIPLLLLIYIAISQGIQPSKYGLTVTENISLSEIIEASIFTTIALVTIYIVINNIAWKYFNFHLYKVENNIPFPEPNLLRVFVVIYLAASAGVVEEIVYRGLPLLYFSLDENRKYQSIKYILLSSLIFGVVHWENGFPDVVAAFVFGLCACFVYLKIRNLWPLIICHLVIDLIEFWK